MKVSLTLTATQHEELRRHLFPGDGKEAVAVALCGRRAGSSAYRLFVRRMVMVPHGSCRRAPDFISWPTSYLEPLLAEAARLGLVILKVHSHPTGYAAFSSTDDASDRDLFPSVHGWVDGDLPHASAVMMPGGEMFGRTVDAEGSFSPLAAISVIGDDLHYWFWGDDREAVVAEAARRHAQLFGAGTTALLGRLAVAVVGCSGTGSVVIEQLARLGIGRLVLVDPDKVEEKNLNRILNTTRADADAGALKVDVMARAVKAIGLGTEISTFAKDLHHPEVVRAVAECDIVFGCMDSVDGRHLLNRLATFYAMPYFDIGVKLVADGRGGIDEVCGTVNYLQPGRSSLLSRGVYTMAQARAQFLKRSDPKTYGELLKSKYIEGVHEDRPAVISVNMMLASLAVNEFLARLHPFRHEENAEYAVHRISLAQGALFREGDGPPCETLARHAARGDVVPLLDMPGLSEGKKP